MSDVFNVIADDVYLGPWRVTVLLETPASVRATVEQLLSVDVEDVEKASDEGYRQGEEDAKEWASAQLVALRTEKLIDEDTYKLLKERLK